VPDLAGAVRSGFQMYLQQQELEERRRANQERERLIQSQMELDFAIRKKQAEAATLNADTRAAQVAQEDEREQRKINYQRRAVFISNFLGARNTAKNFVAAKEAGSGGAPYVQDAFKLEYVRGINGLSEKDRERLNLPDEIEPEDFANLYDTVVRGQVAQTDEDDLMADQATKNLAARLAQDPAMAGIAPLMLDRRNALADPTTAAMLAEEEAKLQALSVRRASATAPRTSVNISNTTQREAEETIVGNRRVVKAVNTILDKDFDEKLFGAGAKFRDIAGSKVNQALAAAGFSGFLDTEFQSKRQVLKTLAGLVLSEQIKRISGAAVSNEEREFIESFIGDIDSMTKEQFEAAQKTFRAVLNSQSELALDTLAEGITQTGRDETIPLPAASSSRTIRGVSVSDIDRELAARNLPIQ